MIDRIEVSVVAFQDGGLWVAQCVEYDIAARAKSLDELPKAFERAVMANICVNMELGHKGLEGIPKAPDHYKNLFETAAYGARPPHKRAVGAGSQVKIRDLRLSAAA